ncbi:response regulator transcription factor [Candidatus Desantisbacteria bacterium]|nr:response regulator transcription factor [Candidatus Desantisbacteria bacterium]
MKQIKAIIAEDEEVLRTSFIKKIHSFWPELIICGETGDGQTAIDLVDEYKPDIAFLDIKMPGLSGLDAARKISGKCLIVFITAYDKYAIEAFENEAIDYLLKPVNDKRLIKTIKRLKNKIDKPNASSFDMTELLDKISTAIPKAPQYLQWIKIQHGDGVRLVSVNDIYYIKSDNKYTLVRTKEGESLIKKTINELEEELNPEQFWRIHRAAIVNINYITKASRTFTNRYDIKLKDIPETLTVSRPYIHLFKQM